MTGEGRPRRFGPDEARNILERAAQIQADEDEHVDDVSTGDLSVAAEQAGISRGALIRAIAEARGLAARPDREARCTREVVEARLRLDAPVSDAAVSRVWDTAIREHGGLGDIEVQGNTRVWRPKSGGGGFEVGVRQGDASTEVWIRRPHRLPIRWLFIVGAVAYLATKSVALGLPVAALGAAAVWIAWKQRQRQHAKALDRTLGEVEAELLRP